MDVLLVGIFMLVEFVMLALSIALPKGILWPFMAFFTGLVLLVGVAADGGITYLSGVTTITISIAGVMLFPFLVPPIMGAMLMIHCWESDRA